MLFQRQSNQSSSNSGSGGGYSKSTTSPYQSQLYDSWKTEWDGAYYDQRDHFRLVTCSLAIPLMIPLSLFSAQHGQLPNLT